MGSNSRPPFFFNRFSSSVSQFSSPEQFAPCLAHLNPATHLSRRHIIPFPYCIHSLVESRIKNSVVFSFYNSIFTRDLLFFGFVFFPVCLTPLPSLLRQTPPEFALSFSNPSQFVFGSTQRPKTTDPFDRSAFFPPQSLDASFSFFFFFVYFLLLMLSNSNPHFDESLQPSFPRHLGFVSFHVGPPLSPRRIPFPPGFHLTFWPVCVLRAHLFTTSSADAPFSPINLRAIFRLRSFSQPKRWGFLSVHIPKS